MREKSENIIFVTEFSIPPDFFCNNRIFIHHVPNYIIFYNFTALAAGLPFLNPYKNNEANFRRANFAVAGSTALPVEVLAGKKISTMVTGSSLSVQLDWMFTHFNAICNTDRGL